MKDKNLKAWKSKKVSRRITVDTKNSPPSKEKKWQFTSNHGVHKFDDLKWAKYVHANYTKYPNQGNNSYGKRSPLVRIKK